MKVKHLPEGPQDPTGLVCDQGVDLGAATRGPAVPTLRTYVSSGADLQVIDRQAVERRQKGICGGSVT